MCIASTGPAGEAYEAEVNAKTLLEWVFPDEPAPGPAVEVAPSAPLRRPHRWRFSYGEAPRAWRFAGPMPLASADEALASLGGPDAAQVGEEAAVRGGAKTVPFVPLDRAYLLDGWLHAERVDLLGALGREGQRAGYFECTVLVDQPRTVRLSLGALGVKAWLAGVPVAHNQRLRLAEGNYSLLLEVRIGGVPAGGLTVAPRLWRCDDPRQERREWWEAVREHRDVWERAARLVPQTEAGGRAAKFLDYLDRRD
jgi:hypothetical protein